MKDWPQALRDGAISGSVASIASTAVLTVCGEKDSNSAVAPTNATSRWIWGDRAAYHHGVDGRHTAVGYLIHHASSTLWAVVYEKWFGKKADKGDLGAALAGGAVVASLACFVDYKVTPYRLQPGFDKRLTTPSMFLTYATFGAALALRGLAIAGRRRRSNT